MKELQDLLEKYQAEHKQLVTKGQPLRDKREELVKKLAPLETELAGVNKELKALNQPKLGELESAIRGLRLTLGLEKPPVAQLAAEGGKVGG